MSFAPHFFPNAKQVQDYVKKHPGATELDWQDQVEWNRIDGKRTNGASSSQAEFNWKLTRASRQRRSDAVC